MQRGDILAVLLCGGDKRTQDADIKRAIKIAKDWKGGCMAIKRRKKETFSRWDAADYLKSDDDMAAYLQACLEEAPDDPALIAAALGDIARARGMVQLAKETGLTREGLYKALSKDGNPSLGTVLKVLKALGLKFTPQVA
jgi:probable addiction module antidote protein